MRTDSMGNDVYGPKVKFTDSTWFHVLLTVAFLIGWVSVMYMLGHTKQAKASTVALFERQAARPTKAILPGAAGLVGQYAAPGGRAQLYSASLEEDVIGVSFTPAIRRNSEEMIAAVNQVALHAGIELQALCMPDLKRIDGVNYVVFRCPDGSGVRIVLLQNEARMSFIGMTLEPVAEMGPHGAAARY